MCGSDSEMCKNEVRNGEFYRWLGKYSGCSGCDSSNVWSWLGIIVKLALKYAMLVVFAHVIVYH